MRKNSASEKYGHILAARQVQFNLFRNSEHVLVVHSELLLNFNNLLKLLLPIAKPFLKR